VDHIFRRLFQLLVAIGVIIIVILVAGRITRRRAPVN
jgi:hypothetical protein